VIVDVCSDLKGTPEECPGIPVITKPAPSEEEKAMADHANYVRVKIESTIPATFGRIIGRNEFTNIVTAVAYAGPVEPRPLVKGSALAALKETGEKTLFGNGTVNLSVIGSGVFNNSVEDCGTTVTGAGSVYKVTTAFQFVSGKYCNNPGKTILDPVVKSSPVEYPPEFNIPTPAITCSGSGSGSYNDATDTWTYTPGNYTKAEEVKGTGGAVLFQPGNYCFSKDFTLKGSANAITNNVNMRITDGASFSLTGASTLTCSNLLVHIDGGTGIKIGGVSEVHCNDVTFFASTGNVVWDGATTIEMYAPLGGIYKGLLIYLPYGNNSDLTITGNSNNKLTGSIIAVSSAIQLRGVGDTTGLHSQIIGYTVEIQGSHQLEIHYDPDENWQVIPPSAITLTK
jgi:hypothetical protein